MPAGQWFKDNLPFMSGLTIAPTMQFAQEHCPTMSASIRFDQSQGGGVGSCVTAWLAGGNDTHLTRTLLEEHQCNKASTRAQ